MSIGRGHKNAASARTQPFYGPFVHTDAAKGNTVRFSGPGRARATGSGFGLLGFERADEVF
ncbi:MAG: hypothetical protein N3I86_16250, partial [Verrucomicrobiae bacterium]|nr:hypothetical protein [Verrucomicrobiae bacterium]